METEIIKKLVKLNKKALKNKEVPVSCIITKNNKIISRAYNSKIKKHDPTAHAEILAIKKAAKRLKTWNLNDCELYVTLYPCQMCIDVINEARIKKVYYILSANNESKVTIKFNKIICKEYDEFYNELTEFFKYKR